MKTDVAVWKRLDKIVRAGEGWIDNTGQLKILHKQVIHASQRCRSVVQRLVRCSVAVHEIGVFVFGDPD